MTSSILNFKTITSTTCLRFLKKCENEVSAIQNAICLHCFRPDVEWMRIRGSVDPGEKLSLERNRDCRRKIRIGVAYALFDP